MRGANLFPSKPCLLKSSSYFPVRAVSKGKRYEFPSRVFDFEETLAPFFSKGYTLKRTREGGSAQDTTLKKTLIKRNEKGAACCSYPFVPFCLVPYFIQKERVRKKKKEDLNKEVCCPPHGTGFLLRDKICPFSFLFQGSLILKRHSFVSFRFFSFLFHTLKRTLIKRNEKGGSAQATN